MVHIEAVHFDLGSIMRSGQCFRMEEFNKGYFRVYNYRKEVIIYQNGKNFFFYCSDEDFENIWRPYFDLDLDYVELDERIPDYDTLLQKAKVYGEGIRILNQDFWEMCVTFILSQNNNIPRIQKCIKAICEKNDGLFPNPAELYGMDLSGLGLGYRDEYLKDMARVVLDGVIVESELREMSYIEAMEKLKEVKGVGDKVANCICLFGLHKMEACPIDVWMRRVLEEDYQAVMPLWVSSPYAGYYQQLAFYYKRSMQ